MGAAFQVVFGRAIYADVYRRSAALLYKIAKAHAFVDGNKRTALLLCTGYLELSGIAVAAPSVQAEIDLVAYIANSHEEQEAVISYAARQLLEWTV